MPSSSRRHFLRTAAAGTGLGVWPQSERAQAAKAPAKQNRLPREIWVATLSQNRMEAKSAEQMIRQMLARMEEVVPLEPDIICLPEVFPVANLSGGRPPVAEVAEVPVGPMSAPFAEFAKKHNCYVVCPIYTKANGRYYNSAVFIDRQGKPLGEYRKIHLTVGEMEKQITPGPLAPPVFRTDFGVVGAQICFDIEWLDGWQELRRAGAELVFWPSAFGGGSMVNTKAWQNKYCVVSSTRKDTSKICDVSGVEVARTGRWDTWACGPLNLEKAFLHTWPFCRRFKDIQAKYGRKVRITTFHEEEWSILESRDPEVKIADVMAEFELQAHEEHIAAAEVVQKANRP